MFAYDDDDLRSMVNENLSHAASPSSKNLRWHLSTVGKIALMMRKFEKASSNNYKKSLQYVFDKEQAISQLKREKVDQQLSMATRLLNQVYFIRKFDIDWQQWTDVDPGFLQSAMGLLKSSKEEAECDLQTEYLFSLALKYLCRNSKTTNLSNLLSPREVLNLLASSKDSAIKTELVWTLGYVLGSITMSPSPDKEILGTQMTNDISTLTLSNSEIGDESKAFLLSQLEAIKNGLATPKDERHGSDEHPQSTTMINRQRETKNKKQLVVSKTIQVMKSSVKSPKCDDVQLKILNLANALRNRSRKTVVNVARQHFETANDESGDDRSMWRTTWAECLNLYQVACSKTLKKDDKDTYLPSKLFGNHYMFLDYPRTRILYEFFINRMVAATFQRISLRQELNDAALDSLMKGIIDEDKLARQMLHSWPHVTPSKVQFYQAIIDGICRDYTAIEGLNGPDLLKGFYAGIQEKVMRVETKNGWIYGTSTIKVCRDPLNESEVHGEIKKELERLRMDVVNALYNSVCRKRKIMTKSRMLTIQDYLTSQEVTDSDEEKFQSILHEIIEIVSESESGLDYKALFTMYLKNLMSCSSLRTSKTAVNFMIRETRDAKRCQEFITSEVLNELIDLLQRDAVEDDIKVSLLEIINNYVGQEFCREGLCESHLTMLILYIKHSGADPSVGVIDGILMSILLTAEKRQCLPSSIVSELISLLDKSFGDFIIVILSRCERQVIREENELDLISEMLFSQHVVVEKENSMVTTEKPSSSTNFSCSVALLAAQLLLAAVEGEQTGIKVSEKTVNNLLISTDSCADNQVRLVTIKCVYLVSIMPKQSSYVFSKDMLSSLQSLVNNEVFLISTYAHAAYVRELATRAITHAEPLTSDFMDSLSSMFVTQDSMKIGEKDFVPEINRHVLEILVHEARKGQKFEDEDLFLIMEEILYGNKCTEFSLKVLEILERYTTSRQRCVFKIPQTTVSALEHALYLVDLADQALICLQNVVCNGQPVSTRTLQLFIDNLQMSDNSRRRLRAFKLLEKARTNQDLSDEAFLKLELVRAAYGLSINSSSMQAMKRSMLLFLQEKSQKGGMQMPKDTMLVLENHVNDEATLEILYNVSKNRQIIQYNLLHKLMKRFNPTDFSVMTLRIMDIFENVARNNQTLSDKLLTKLEQVFDSNEEQLEVKVLSIFVQRANKGEQLSGCVVEKVLDKIGNIEKKNIMFEQELLSSIGSIVLQSSDGDLNIYKGRMQKILWEGIMSDNSNTQKICANGWVVLMRRTQIETRYLSELVEICTDSRRQSLCDHSVVEKLFSLVKENLTTQIGFTEDLRSKLELAELTKVNDVDTFLDSLFCQMVKMNGHIALLDQNYIQLANILNTQLLDAAVKRRALALLESYKFKSEMSRELLESVALLYESTSLKDVKQSCLSLLQVSSTKEVSSSRVHQILSRKCAEDNADCHRQQFLSSSSPLLVLFKEQLKLNHEQIAHILNILNITDCEMLMGIKSLDEFLEILLSSHSRTSSNFHESSACVLLIEQVLITSSESTKNKQAMECYNRLIKRGKFQNLKAVAEKLLTLFSEEIDTELLIALTECIFLSIPYLVQVDLDLFLECLEALEYKLQHEHVLVRVLSYAGLAFAADHFSVESTFFKEWCYDKLEELSKLANVQFTEQERLDLLYVIVSLKSIDLDAFNRNREVWHRELFISNLFRELEPCSDTEKLEFYSIWLEIEQKHAAQLKSAVFLFHLSLNVSLFKSLKQVNEVLFVIRQSEFVPEFSELNIDDVTMLFQHSLKQNWCMRLIDDSLQNKKDYDQVYLEQLATSLCKNFEAAFIQKLFDSIVCIDDLNAFESLMEFCSSRRGNKILENFMLRRVRYARVADLISLLQIEDLCDNFTSSSANREQMSVLYGLLHGMLRKRGGSSWTFEQLNQMITTIKQDQDRRTIVQIVINLFQIISFYELSPAKYKECLDIFKAPDALKNLNKLIVENKFHQRETIKNAAELLQELEEDNSSSSSSSARLKEYIGTTLRQQLWKVKNSSLWSPNVSFAHLPISQWERKHISQWATNVGVAENKDLDIVEAIAVVKRANFWHTGFHLTDTQILASLISLCDYTVNGCDESIRGKLLQVATGEGKSTIVCILAIVNALREGANGGNMQVDVITSSPTLAERDAVEKGKLFKMFNLTCSFNNDTGTYIQGVKDCYKANIVYGEVSQFQFDKLRDNYSQLGTQGDRQCRVAIVDEVDSILIDDSSKIARLSSTSAGMDHFQPVYVFLWHRLLDIQRRFIMFDSKMYLLNGKVEFEQDKLTMRYSNEQGEIIKIPDLEDYIRRQMGSLSPSIGEPIQSNIDEFLEKKLRDYLDALVKENIVKVPANFEEFFSKQRSKWVMNAIEALNYQENVQYVVHDGQIKPVDYFSTGIVQSATNWSDGLHQFLQLKHSLKMRPETLTTNFLSNIGFINAYDRVFGLTGTLGSKKAREVLRSVYKVDMINVPQLRQKQYVEFPTMVSPNETKWFQDICSAALVETRKDRGVLIICETIKQVNTLNDCLIARYRPSAIKTYTMNNMDQERQIEKVLPGDVVIATNLAGRGTDIQTDAIEKWGGMHVIVTFMPQNQRVQEQVFGRTARQGKLGTGQMILNMQQLGVDYQNVDPSRVKNQRDEVESRQLDLFRNDDLHLIQMKDELFGRFCKFLNEEIRSDLRRNVKKGSWKSLKELFSQVTPTTYEVCVLSAIEEQWAMFWRKLDDKTLAIADATDECESLLRAIRENYENNNVIKNLYYHIVIGNDLIRNQSESKTAKEHFCKVVEAVQGDPKNEKQFYGAAHVGIAWSSIAIEEVKTSQKKHPILDAFKQALDILSTEMALLNSVQGFLHKASSSSGGFGQSDLDNQLNVRTTILGSYLNSVQQCMRVIKKSLRLIDVLCVDDKAGTSELFVDIDREHNMDIIAGDNVRYQLSFNDLTVYKDSGDEDQAVKTIDKAYPKDGTMDQIKSAFGSKYLSSNYKGLKLQLNQISLSRVRALLNENKEFEDELTAQSAINQLEKERTCWNAMEHKAQIAIDLLRKERTYAMGITSSYEVDLTIVHPDGGVKIESNIPINEAINLIESKLEADKLRYKFTIKKASINNINSCFWTTRKQESQPTFQVAFDGLDKNSAVKFVELFDAGNASAEVEMLANKADLLQLFNTEHGGIAEPFNNTDMFCFNVCIQKNKQKKYQRVKPNELMQSVKALESDEKSIALKVEVKSASKARDLMAFFPGSLFNISFADVQFTDLWKLLSDRQELGRTAASFSFQSLDRSLVKLFVKALRLQNLEFCLVFSELSYKQAMHVIQNADLTQEAIHINKVPSLAEMFMKDQIPYAELAEFAARGIEYLLEISEKRFIPWFSICTVAAMGTLQIVIGGILVATGFGATVGMSLISEGVSDMLYACRAYSSRQFDWTDYAKQKAVSFVISVCSVGIGKLKDAGKDAAKGAATLLSGEASVLAQEATKEAAEAAATQFATHAKSIGKDMLKSGQNLKSLAFKYVGVKAGEAIVREGMNNGMQYLTNMSMDLVKPYISDHIQQRVQLKFCNPQLNCLLKKMSALDSVVRSKTLQDRVTKIVADAVNPDRGFISKQWNSVGLPLLKGILGTTEKYGSASSMGFRIVATLQGLYAVQAIVDNVHEQVSKRLSQIDQDSLTMNLILEQHLKVEKEEARAISLELALQKADILCIVSLGNLHDSKNEYRELELTISKYKKTNEKVGSFLSSFLDKFMNMEKSFEQSVSLIVKSVSDRITDQIIRIIDSQLVSPWSTLAVSGLTDALSKRIQHYCLVDKDQNTDALNNDQKKFDELSKRRANGEQLNGDDKKFMQRFGAYRTFGQQINYNSQAYCLDYQRYSVKYFAEHATESVEVSREIRELAKSVRDNKPASMAEMSVLNKEFGNIKLKVTSDESYKPTPEEIAQGIKVVYIQPGPKDVNGVDQIGHAYIVNDDGSKTHVPAEPNDCFYMVYSTILETQGIEKSVDQLRQITADAIESNANFALVLEAEKWIDERYPVDSNSLLFAAGVITKNPDSDLEVEDTDITDLLASVSSQRKRGEPYDRQFKTAIKTKNTHNQYTIRNPDGTTQSVSGSGNVHLHHVVPNNQIIQTVSSQSTNPAGLKQEVTKYINLPHIKPLVMSAMANRMPGTNDGVLLNASISWNPNNVVAGPDPNTQRIDDGGSNIDTAISNKQSPAFQNAVNNFTQNPSLTAFSAVPAAQPVEYELDPKNPGKYRVL